MKSKLVFITGILLTLALAPSTHAKTDITGDVYGEVISTMDMNDVSYGVTIEDLNTVGENCDNDAQTCYLEGFSWADKIGWTYWDGMGLQGKLGAGAFPNEYIAKATYNGNLGGYIWGEKYGWVALSACTTKNLAECTAVPASNYCTWTGTACEIDKSGRIADLVAQDDVDWGVYIDFCPLKADKLACENVADNSDTYCNWDNTDMVCVFDKTNNPNGQPFKGYAWSQYLGWIKFGPEGADTGFNGAFTNWFPDLTPPVFKGIDHAWIPNEDILGTISWLEFADENDSYVDVSPKSKITVNTAEKGAGPDFTGCPLASPQTNGNVVITQGDFGEANLTIPKIGQIVTPPYGFCAFTLEGAIYNASGFGFYFGPKGADIAVNDDGVDLSDPEPNVIHPKPINLYVRAGDLNIYQSNLLVNVPANPIADGNSTIDITLTLLDQGDNPIMPVKAGVVPDLSNLPEDQSLWIRDVELLYDFSTSEYYFDSIDWIRDISLGYPIPIKIEIDPYLSLETLQYPPGGPGRPTLYGKDYLLDIIGYAPTTTSDNSLVLETIELTPLDLELPAVSPSQPAVPANTDPIALNAPEPIAGKELPSNDSITLPYHIDFEPALDAISGSLSSPILVISQPVEAKLELKNNSTLTLTNFNLDHLFTLRDVTEGIGEELLEVSDINLIPLNDTTGRTDPDSTEARYSLIHNAGFPNINQFHNASQNYHPPTYDFNEGLNADGIYKISGDLYVSPDNPCLVELENPCPLIDLDRSDKLSLNLAAPGSTDSYSFGFTPTQFIGEAVNAQVEFGITQYIAHPASNYINPNQFVLYPATPQIDDVEVKSVGLATPGTVSGGQVFETGRELDAITTTSSADLRREIRKNVAVLTRNLDPCSPFAAPFITIDSLLLDGDCFAHDPVNKTVVAYYSGPGTINLGTGADIIVPADYKYTIILVGADLNIESNISYGGDTKNSFGIIVMEDSDGNGGEVFLDPAPTNIVGLLYAEGSLRSSPDAGGTFYYGGGANASDLTNQYYWQGSIAFKNTIGGASYKVIPEGVDCGPWGDDVLGCAQAYDLDFIRRFATIDKGSGSYAPAGYKFSGGGSCLAANPAAPACSHGPLGISLSTVSIDGGGFIELPPASESLDTFFIERDNRPVPPGFSSSGGLTSSQEIR